jgi:hypothetical protein
MIIMRTFLFLLILLRYCASTSTSINPTGIVNSRKPVLIGSTNSADMPIPTSTKPVKKQTITVEAPSPIEDAEDAEEPAEPTEDITDVPQTTANPKTPGSEPITSTNPSSPTDPTDYSTVWPTRWRPRRRFGAQSEAPAQFYPNWKSIAFILIIVILL